MNLSGISFTGGLIAFLICAILFYISTKVDKEYTKYGLIGGFYFLVIAFVFLLVGTGYGYTAPADCNFEINHTHVDENATGHAQIAAGHIDTEYEYIDGCLTNYDTGGLEAIYIVLLWSFFGIILAGISILIYLLWEWVTNIW